MNPKVIISRESAETVGGVPQTGRVYITGPHFNEGIYSSTREIARASTFERDEAERLLREGKWSRLNPRIEPAP